MAGRARAATLEKLNRLRRMRRVQNAATLGLVLLGPVLAVLTFLILGPLDRSATAFSLRLVLLADLVYVLVVAALVAARVGSMIIARRRKSAGSRLHLRLTGVFGLIALIPTVTVAIFAGLTINIGLEGWFSERVRSVVGASLSATEAYQQDQRNDLRADAEALAGLLDGARTRNFFVSDGELRQLLGQAQGQIQRGLREAYVIDGAAEIRTRGERSYLFDFERPDAADLARAKSGETVIIEDLVVDEMRALMPLSAYPDRYLYVARDVDGRILGLLDDAEETAKLYTKLESERGRVVFEFGLLYLGFAVILILAAIWLGLWFAERLAQPVGRLAGAAQRVGDGDLDVRVPDEPGEDEIAMLGRLFNQMTRQLKGQRDALLETHQHTEERRRLFDSVLSSVTAGVIGLDAEGRTTFINKSAERILKMDSKGELGVALDVFVPEFAPLLKELQTSRREVEQAEVRLTRRGAAESLLVRVALRDDEDGENEGYVIAFDDVTDLVTAQRMAAWGDVARRIAHEIKNPLTPIQLSAERIKRKFRDAAGEDVAQLDSMTDVIIRQTDDLRRIVDEFSKFARMPEPDTSQHDLGRLVSDAVLLQQDAAEGVSLDSELPDHPVMAELDSTMIGQALTNLIKNAGEAVESLKEKLGLPDGHNARVLVELQTIGDTAKISISDNGIGLPEDRSRLFEPYVTTREKGTGLGLPIVKKIIEEHGGTLNLVDADPLDASGQIGARAEILLPILAGQSETSDLKVAE